MNHDFIKINDNKSKHKPVTGIYLIINNINNKKYIGQSVNVYERWREHISEPNMTSRLDLAIKKYGYQNFDCFLLESCLREELNQKEYEWSMVYNDCYIPTGYNIQICGSSINLNYVKTISSYDLSGHKIKTYKCVSDAASDVGVSASCISAAAKHLVGSKTAANLLWNFGSDDAIIPDLPKTSKNGGKRIYQYDIKTGEFIQSFKSTKDAEKFLKIDDSSKNLSACCNKKILSAYGYYRSYEKFDNYLLTNKQTYYHKKVSMYDKKTYKLIKSFNTLSEGAKFVNTTKGNIWVACNNPNRSSMGYFWRYGEKEYIGDEYVN